VSARAWETSTAKAGGAVPGAEARRFPQRHGPPRYQIERLPSGVQPSDVPRIRVSFSAPRLIAGVAGPAIPGSRFVHDHPSRRDLLRVRMTESAANVFVSACEFKGGSPVMVKRRRLPFDKPVTTGTVGRVTPCRKLAAVNIIVAP